MFETIVRLYKETHSKKLVANAVKRKFISIADYKKITGEDYTN